MKSNFKSKIAGYVIIAASLIFIAGYLQWLFAKAGTPKSKSFSWSQNTVKPIDDVAYPDTLPYNRYLALKDSVTTIRDLKNGSGQLDSPLGQFIYLGTQVSLVCDTCTSTWARDQILRVAMSTLAGYGGYDGADNDHLQYYIKLYAFTIKKNYPQMEDDGVFYAEKGQGYLRTTYKDETKEGLKAHMIKVVDEPVKFRYDAKEKSLLIPVTKGQEKVFRVISQIMLGLYAIGILFLLYLFLRFIYDTSVGKPFTRKNVRRLGIIALSVSCWPAVVVLINLSMRLIFHEYFTPQITLKGIIWEDSWSTFRLGILLTLLWGAFNRATRLQEEQDLTV
jgi:hypothetical protein